MFDRLKVTNDYILVKEIKQEINDNGLVSPTSFEEKTDWGEVIKIGDNCKIKIGSRVFFNRYCTIKIKLADGMEFLVLKEEDVVAYLEPEEEKI